MKYRAFLLSVFITSLLILTGCGEISDTRTIKLAHGLDVTHPVHKGMVRMAELVHKKSNNQLQIDIYPSQQLGSERETLELLQIGSVDMTKVSAAVLENFVPDIRVFSLPYLFRDTEHYYNTLDGEVGRELLLAGEDFWLRGLTYYDAGQRSFYTQDRPIRTPEDLEGLKIRVQESPMAVNMVRTLGGSPTPISWGELYTALQQGIVDGAENNPPSYHSSRHYEVTNYFSLDQHSSIPDILLISTHLWDNLNEQEQQWIQEAADSSKIYQRKIWAEAEQEALEVVKEAGIEVIRPDKEPFRKKVEVIYEEFEQNEPEFFDLIQSIRDVK